MRLKILISWSVLLASQHAKGTADEVADGASESYRSKRQLNTLPLVYPYGSTYRFILGLASPVKVDQGISLVFGAAFLYQYTQFTNITQLSQYYPINTVSREQRSSSSNSNSENSPEVLVAEKSWKNRKDERLAFYRAAEEMLTVKGFNGPECVLRAICEAAQYPVGEEGLFGELLHILLTPTYGKDLQSQSSSWKQQLSDYIGAQEAGEQMFSCQYLYPGCPAGEGILDLITVLRDE